MTLDLLHFPCGQSPEVFKNFFRDAVLGQDVQVSVFYFTNVY